MSTDILLFVPRSNPKADRAFWKGQESLGPQFAAVLYDNLWELYARADPLEAMAVEVMNQIFPEIDTAPAEYCAGEKDPA